jgi:hypothetical protein
LGSRGVTVCAAVRAISVPEGPAVLAVLAPALEGPAVSVPAVREVSAPEGPAVLAVLAPAVRAVSVQAVRAALVQAVRVASAARLYEGRTMHWEIYSTEDAFSA